jgi:CRISPR-associated protein Cmr2
MTKKYLMALSLGPVQEFIAAARRTRDLWFGSYLLSEISKAVALGLAKQGAELIFPATEDINQLNQMSVANKLLVLLPEDRDPREFANLAEVKAQQRWNEFTMEALKEARDFVDELIWNEQANDVLEFYAAWVPLEDTQADYKRVWKRVEQILAGRKALRDFLPARGRQGVPKSSLDGARESVLKPSRYLSEHHQLRYGIKANEQLDVVGLTKRLAGGKKSYPSVARVAVDPWVRGVLQHDPLVLNPIQSLLMESKLVDLIKAKQYTHFPFDGAILLPSQLEELKKEYPQHTVDVIAIQAKLQPLIKVYREPSSYLAVLLADGDKMGATIADLGSLKAHKDLSSQLSKFAGQAEKIVEKHFGVLIYSGGDDVLAFLPLDTCLTAARELYHSFDSFMGKFSTKAGDKPTLSVGIGIGHCLEPLEDLLNMGRKAEKAAKSPDRDGFAFYLQTRSGGDPLLIRRQWRENLDKTLFNWIKLFLEEELSDRTAYDIRQLAQEYLGWPKQESINELLTAELERLLKKKRTVEGGKLKDKVAGQLCENVTTAEDLQRLADELLVARHLSEAYGQASYRLSLDGRGKMNVPDKN